MNGNDTSIPLGKPSQNSRAGMLSTAVGVVAALGTLLFTATARFGWFRDQLPANLHVALAVLLTVVIGLLTLVGIGFGISSLVQKGNRKLLGVLGCLLNGIVFGSFCLFPSITFFQTNGYMVRDGCILGTAKVWIDQNENGIWDTNEQPLSSVQFVIYDSNSPYAAKATGLNSRNLA